MNMIHLQQRTPREIELQAAKEELDSSRKKIERYEHLLATLYDELDNLRNTICNNCKKKLVPGASSANSYNPIPLWRRVFGGRPAFHKMHWGSPQNEVMSTIRNADTSSTFSPTNHVSSESTFVPPTVPLQTTNGSIANSPIVDADWPVVHNQEVTQILNVHLDHTLRMKSRVSRVKFNREGTQLAVGLETGEAYIYDMKALSKSARVLVEHPAKRKPIIVAMQFTPDGKYIAVGGFDGRIKVWNIAEKRVLAVFEGNLFPFSIAFSHDGRFFVSGSHIWCVRDGSSMKLLDNNTSVNNSTALSPDGRHIASSNNDGMLRIWDFRSGKSLARWKAKGDERQIWVKFTPDGKELLSLGDDEKLRVWDISSLTIKQSGSRRCGVTMDEEKEIFTLRRHTYTLLSISPILDSRWVLSSSADHTLCIWDSRTGIWQFTLKGHRNIVTTTGTSSDGHLASGSADCLVMVWRYEQGGLVAS